jgi:hypothetical protein
MKNSEKIEFLFEYGYLLNDWEAGFLDSIEVRLAERTDELTFNQQKKLNEIYNRIDAIIG